jgi:hypothetical protein
MKLKKTFFLSIFILAISFQCKAQEKVDLKFFVTNEFFIHSKNVLYRPQKINGYSAGLKISTSIKKNIRIATGAEIVYRSMDFENPVFSNIHLWAANSDKWEYYSGYSASFIRIPTLIEYKTQIKERISFSASVGLYSNLRIAEKLTNSDSNIKKSEVVNNARRYVNVFGGIDFLYTPFNFACATGIGYVVKENFLVDFELPVYFDTSNSLPSYIIGLKMAAVLKL